MIMRTSQSCIKSIRDFSKHLNDKINKHPSVIQKIILIDENRSVEDKYTGIICWSKIVNLEISLIYLYRTKCF